MVFPKAPLLFTPVFCETIWGGNRLATEFGKNLPIDTLIGESWELSGFSSRQTAITAGPLQGITLGALYSRFPAELAGVRAGTSDYFPLLVKFIDARQPLSVQVHPDDATAQLRFNEPCGKTECWYIAHAGKNARLALGFTRTLNRKELEDAITTGDIEQLLNIFPVKTGEVFFIPAGTVHAIMGDVIIYEVQQTSNTTLRLYDWMRVDANGKPREHHLEDGVAISSLAASSGIPEKGLLWKSQGITSRLRVACPYFALEEFSLKPGNILNYTARSSCAIMTVMNGSATISCDTGTANLYKGSTVLLPASLDKADIGASADTTLLSTFIPDMNEEIVGPLKRQGYTVEEISSAGAAF